VHGRARIDIERAPNVVHVIGARLHGIRGFITRALRARARDTDAGFTHRKESQPSPDGSASASIAIRSRSNALTQAKPPAKI